VSKAGAAATAVWVKVISSSPSLHAPLLPLSKSEKVCFPLRRTRIPIDQLPESIAKMGCEVEGAPLWYIV
jgi:hypothetical protein